MAWRGPTLVALRGALHVMEPRLSANPSRASTALILRSVLAGGEQHDLELLFIKRAADPRDPWSGNVAFPGGRRSPADKDDVATAVRETWEEVGLDLTKDFIYLGRLDESYTVIRGRRADLAISPCVFYQTVEHSPTLTLQVREVQACRWVPLTALTPRHVDYRSGISIPITSICVPLRLLPLRWLRIQFPTIHLPAQPGDPQADVAFPLWGFSLRCASELLRLAHLHLHSTGTHPVVYQPLDWPPYRAPTVLGRLATNAVCGAVELYQWPGGDGRGTRLPLTGSHITALALLLLCLLTAGLALVLLGRHTLAAPRRPAIRAP
eukprot:EG_transcript_19637